MTDLDRKRGGGNRPHQRQTGFQNTRGGFRGRKSRVHRRLVLDRTAVLLLADLPFLGWGLGLSYHAWCVYAPKRPISEDEIEREDHESPA